MKVIAAAVLLLCTSQGSSPAPPSKSTERLSAAQLGARIESAPQLPLRRTELRVRLAAGQSLGMVSWLAHDSQNGVTWLVQRGTQAEPVIAVDAEGRVLHSFGRGQFTIPHAIRLDRAGHIWTVDAGSSKVVEFTPDGQKLREIDVGGPAKADDGAFRGATDVAFAPDGRILVSDGYASARMVEYTTEGKELRVWGRAGGGPGEFNLPHAVVIDVNGVVYVADRENGRIQKFDLAGRWLGEISGLGRTYDVALGADGTLWASMSPRDEPPGSPGWLVKLDRRSGKILGYVAVRESGGLHCLDVDSDGEPMTDVGSTVVWFRH